MPGHNPFDMDFLGFDYLVRYVLGSDAEEEEAKQGDQRSGDEAADGPGGDHPWPRLS